MPKQYTAKQGDSLCIIAIRKGGFLDCNSLRNAPENSAFENKQINKGETVTIPDKEEKQETEKDKKKHKHKKKNSPIPSIRFVHGSEHTAYPNEISVDVLQVSSYPTDKGGPTPIGNQNWPNPFPSTYGFDAKADIDKDTFKIEVIDPGVASATDTVKVRIEVLKPKYTPEGTITYESFDPSETDTSKCKIIDLECKRVAAKSVRFRSKYLRLVVDSDDFAGAPGQTLLVPDIADGTDGDRDKVEILDQQVLAEYDLSSCPKKGTAAAKCIVHEQLPIGENGRKKRVKMVIHILRNGRDGPGVVTIEKAQKACLQYIRQMYAQAELSVKLIAPKVQLIQPPKNMIVIDNRTGHQANGGGAIRIRIKIDTIEKTLDYTTGRKDSPYKTAKKMTEKIKNLFVADFPALKVQPSSNPPIKPLKYQRSADILVGNPQTQEIELVLLSQNDSKHIFEIGIINTTNVAEFAGPDPDYVGTIDERILIKNYDTGKDQIDLFVVGTLSAGSIGEAFVPRKNKKFSYHPKRYRSISTMVNTAIVQKDVADPTNYCHFAIPHEIGHILLDAIHVARRTEMMESGQNLYVTFATTRKVDGPKRISDESITFVYPGNPKGNPVSMLRKNNRGLIDGW